MPGPAAERLRLLQQHVADLHVLTVPLEDRQAANTARFEAEARLKRLKDSASAGGFELDDRDPRVKAEQKRLNVLAAEAKRLNDINEVRSAAWRVAAQTVQAVTAWLQEGKPAGTVLEVYEGRAPALQKGESLLDAVENRRRRIRELKSDIARINAAPFPSAHARAKMRQTVEALATRGAVSVSRLIEHDADIEFADEHRTVPVVAGSKENPVSTVVGWQQPDVLALVCWLHKDAIVARLDAEIAAESDDRAALTHEAREKAVAEVATDMLAVEREECFWLFEALSQNLPTPLRVDVDPLALLGLQLRTVAPRVVPGSTGGHGYDLVGLLRR